MGQISVCTDLNQTYNAINFRYTDVIFEALDQIQTSRKCYRTVFKVCVKLHVLHDNRLKCACFEPARLWYVGVIVVLVVIIQH